MVDMLFACCMKRVRGQVAAELGRLGWYNMKITIRASIEIGVVLC